MLTERISSFSDTTLADSLLSLYVNNPFYHTVYGIEREVKVNRVSRNGLFGQVIDHYIENDSVNELIILMAGQSEISYKMDAFSTALVYSNLNLAHEIFNNLEPESETDQYWAQISGIALQLADSGLTWFSMDSAMEGTVMNIAQIEPECTAKRNAQSILKLVRGLDFIEPAIMGDSIEARVAPSLSNQVSVPGMNKGELFINNEIIIYPNPIISGQLHIEFTKPPGYGYLKITDIDGKTVRELVIPDNIWNVRLSVQNLKSGIYFVHFDNDQNHLRARFVISNG